MDKEHKIGVSCITKKMLEEQKIKNIKRNKEVDVIELRTKFLWD